MIDFYFSKNWIRNYKTGVFRVEKMLLSVKGGKFKANDIRDLIGVVLNNNAKWEDSICFDESTKAMKEKMFIAGYYKKDGYSNYFLTTDRYNSYLYLE